MWHSFFIYDWIIKARISMIAINCSSFFITCISTTIKIPLRRPLVYSWTECISPKVISSKFGDLVLGDESHSFSLNWFLLRLYSFISRIFLFCSILTTNEMKTKTYRFLLFTAYPQINICK